MPKGKKLWTKEMDDKIRYAYFHHCRHVDVAKDLGVTRSAVSSRGHVLGLSRRPSVAQKLVCQTDWRKEQINQIWTKRRKNKMKVKDYLQERRETEDYKFGWQSAERGEPKPPHDNADQHLGWKEYHEAQGAQS